MARRSRSPLARWLAANLRLALAGPPITLFVAAALLGPWLVPFDPLKIDAANILASPSATHIFGTDEIGRDVLSRVVLGARVSLAVAAAAVLVAMLVGVPVGLIAAYRGGAVENATMRSVDVLVCMPEIFVAVVVMAFLQNSLPTLVLTIGLLYFPQFARVTHGVAASVRRRDFVLAAVSLGASPARIIASEILPNIASVVIVQASFTLSFAMLLEAGLSFLGLGVMPPTPSWGQMVGSLKDYLLINPWPLIFPSLALLLTVFAVNTLGDWLQDRLNPEIRK